MRTHLKVFERLHSLRVGLDRKQLAFGAQRQFQRRGLGSGGKVAVRSDLGVRLDYLIHLFGVVHRGAGS